MKAILLRRPGGPEALEYVEVPTPVPGEGKVLVKADTIGVSMPEVLVRRGTYAWMPSLPAIPGIELSGTVVAHGPNNAEPALGQPVFVSARDLPVRAGCYAEYIAVPARAAYPLPPGCSLEAAACLSNYQVAYHVLHTAARGVEAKRVLVRDPPPTPEHVPDTARFTPATARSCPPFRGAVVAATEHSHGHSRCYAGRRSACGRPRG